MVTGGDVVVRVELGFPAEVPPMLRGVAGRGFLGPLVRASGRIWRAARTPAGPATLAMTPSGDAVDVEAWGPGADAAASTVADLFGAADDPAAFEPRDAVVARVAARRPTVRMPRTSTVFEHLVPTIIGQKVPGASAAASWQGVLRRWGETPPGPAPPALRLGPHPDVLASLAYHDLHAVNLERRRAEVVLTCARRWRRLEEAAVMAPADARQRLEAIRGVGPWTSSIVSQLALGDPDAVIVGDDNIPAIVAWNLAGERTADDARMLELLEPYRGQRARVQNLLKAGGTKPPRHGPRLSVVDLAGR